MDLKEEKERGKYMRGKEHSRWGTASAKSLRGEVPDEHKEGREAGDGGDAAGNWTMLGHCEEDVVLVHSRPLLSHKKEWNWVICSDVDEPRVCCTE